jgi:hypothetical protein
MWNLNMSYPYRFEKQSDSSQKIYNWEIVKFLKKSNIFKDRPPTVFRIPSFSNLVCDAIGRDLTHLYARVIKMAGTDSKKVMEMVSYRLY